MATIIRTVHWTVLTDVEAALALLTRAVEQTDFTVASLSPEAVVIDVPRAIRKNRWAATITGAVSPSDKGTDIEWTVDGLGNKHYEHLATIAEGLPEGSLYDHGIPNAVSKVTLKIFGRKEIRHLANVLDRNEAVQAIGVGKLGNKMGIVALTDRRLLFLEKSIGGEDLVDFSLNSIGALSLAKKMGGETLTVAHSGTSAVITGMGHGQGDGITRKFRELKDRPAHTAQASPVPADPITQIERLAALRDRGILSEEEFQAQKSQILANM
jgi:hypothetical protein